MLAQEQWDPMNRPLSIYPGANGVRDLAGGALTGWIPLLQVEGSEQSGTKHDQVTVTSTRLEEFYCPTPSSNNLPQPRFAPSAPSELICKLSLVFSIWEK